MKPMLARLDARRERARLGGGKERIAAQHAKGKLTARERVELLLDHNSFEEFDMFVEHRSTIRDGEDQDSGRRGGDRLGYRQRPDCLCVRQGFHGVRRLSQRGACQKITKIQDMALKNRAPIVGLFDAGGARIQEGVAALGGYGEVFQRNVLASGVVPQISVIRAPAPAAMSIRRR